MDYYTFALKYVSSGCTIKRVIKRSIMGNEFDKTWDYYRGNLVPSPLDDGYIVEFSYKTENFIIECDTDKLEDVFAYIRFHSFEPNVDNILVAFEANGDTYNDITHNVYKFYGPENNFYSNENFNVLRKYITKYPLYIIDKNFHIHSFIEEDDIVDIFCDGKIII